MNRLTARLPFQECLEALREQISPLTFFTRHNIYRPKTSKVLGRVWDDGRFILESGCDPFSKRLAGVLTPSGEHTIIEYTWEHGVRHRMYGSPRFDEEESLSFLEEWLGARTLNGSSPEAPSS